MGVLYRRWRKGAGGERVRSKVWYIRFHDANGRQHDEAAFSDKSKSRQLLGERENAAREGKLDSSSYWRRWLRMPLWSETKGVQTHVDDYVAHLEAKGTGAGQRERVRGHLRNAFKAMGVVFVPEVAQASVERNLVELLRDGRSAATRNHRLSALRSFWRWGMATKRFRPDSDPTAGLASMRAEALRVRPRRNLTMVELGALIAAARERPLANYLANHGRASETKAEALRTLGEERATVYVVGAYSGLRRNELRELRWGDVRLECERPHLVVRAASAKARREEIVELSPTAVAYLAEWKACETRRRWSQLSSTGHVFTCVSHGLLKAMWADCAYARVPVAMPDGSVGMQPIPVVTQDGRVDVHALRHTFGTLLCAAGVPVHVAQRLMRHRDPRTTLRIYAHVGDAARQDAVNRLPCLDLERGEARRAEGGGA